METVYETIVRLIEEKKSKHIAPISIIINEIRRARDKLLRDKLNSLYLEKNIKKVRLINEISIII